MTNALEDLPAKASGAGAVLCEGIEAATRLLGPMMPHLAEEMWQTLGHAELIADAALAHGRSRVGARRTGDDRGAGQRQITRHRRVAARCGGGRGRGGGTGLAARQPHAGGPRAEESRRRAHGPRDGHRVIVEGLDSHSPIEPALPISLVGLGLSYDLFGGQRNGLGKLITRQVIGHRKQQLSGLRLLSVRGPRAAPRLPSDAVLVARRGDLAVRKVDFEQILRRADRPDRGMRVGVENFGLVSAVLVGRDITIIALDREGQPVRAAPAAQGQRLFQHRRHRRPHVPDVDVRVGCRAALPDLAFIGRPADAVRQAGIGVPVGNGRGDDVAGFQVGHRDFAQGEAVRMQASQRFPGIRRGSRVRAQVLSRQRGNKSGPVCRRRWFRSGDRCGVTTWCASIAVIVA
jgi:hypothetical protein